MKNTEWVDLPVFNLQVYPKRIRDISKRVGAPVEEIAENEGVSPGAVLWEWINREDIQGIFRIFQYPDDENMSVLLLLSGEQIVVDMPHKKLMNKIHKFLTSNRQYDFERGAEIVLKEVEDHEQLE